MPESSDSGQSALVKNRNALDDYLGSVKGIYAFASSACWDEAAKCLRPDSYRCAPRTMKRADKKGSSNLTPDCVVQVTSRYGVVVEMKKHYQEEDLRPFEQIKKYDCKLIGWWTPDELIESHDLVLLTHYFSSTNAQDAFELWKTKNAPYERQFAIVEFSYSDQGQSYFALKRVSGSLSDAEHDSRLRRGVKIPETVFVEITGRLKFYDADPPLIHMLVLIQDYILPTMFSEDQYGAESEEGIEGVDITVATMRRKLEEQFCDTRHKARQPSLPKASWVKEALEALSDMGLAMRQGKGRYKVFLRKPTTKDSISYFTSKLLELEARRLDGQSEGEAKQLNLQYS